MATGPRDWDVRDKKLKPRMNAGNFLLRSELGQPDGVCDLDGDGKVPPSRLPPASIASPSITGVAKVAGCRFVWTAADRVTLVPSGLDGKACVPVVDADDPEDFQVIEITASLEFRLPNHLDTGSEAGNAGYDCYIEAQGDGTYRPLVCISGATPVLTTAYTHISPRLMFLSNSQGTGGVNLAPFVHEQDGTVRYDVIPNDLVEGVLVLGTAGAGFTGTALTAVDLAKAIPYASGVSFWLQARGANLNATLSTLALYRTNSAADANRFWFTNLSTSAAHRSGERVYIGPLFLKATPATSLYARWSVNTGDQEAYIGVVAVNLGITWGDSVIVSAVEGGGSSDYVDPLTTKGDLVGRTATATVRVPVGTDGQVPTADSGASAGWSWQAPSGSSDAATLDGLDSTQFLRSDTSDSFTSGTLTMGAGTTLDNAGNAIKTDAINEHTLNAGVTIETVAFEDGTIHAPDVILSDMTVQGEGFIALDAIPTAQYRAGGIVKDSASPVVIDVTNPSGDMELQVQGDKVWHAGNDGAGSGLDADTVDGLESAQFLRSDAATVFNDAGANIDLRAEGDTDQNLVFLDASADAVGFGTSSPAQKVDVNGNIRTAGYVETAEISTPSTPGSGFGRYFTTTGNKPAFINDAGTVYDISGSAGAGGSWQLIASNTVSGSAVTTVQFSGLTALAAGQMWVLHMQLFNPTGGTVSYSLLAGSGGALDTTAGNYRRQTLAVDATTVTGARASDAVIASVLTNTYGIGEFHIQRDVEPRTRAMCWMNNDTATAIKSRDTKWIWNATTNPTDLGIQAGTASAIGISSEFRLYLVLGA